MLHDKMLLSDKDFVHKTPACVEATAGYVVSIDEPTPQGPIVDPKRLIADTINIYNSTVNDLLKQGYPRAIAESTAKRYLLDDK